MNDPADRQWELQKYQMVDNNVTTFERPATTDKTAIFTDINKLAECNKINFAITLPSKTLFPPNSEMAEKG